MDKEYIKLCAEMAYNEVIFMEEYNILNEGAISDRLSELSHNFITFCKKIVNKIISFIKEKINQLKQLIRDMKVKKAEKKAKQESASMYDQLMEMLLTEKENDSANWEYVYDVMFPMISDICKNLEPNISKYSDNNLEKANKGFGSSDKDEIQKLKEDIMDNKVIFTVNTEKFGAVKMILSKESKDIIQHSYDEACDASKGKSNYKSKYDFTLYSIKEMEAQMRSAEAFIRDFTEDVEYWSEKEVVKDNDPLKNDKVNLAKILIQDSMSTINNATSILIACNAILFRISLNCARTF